VAGGSGGAQAVGLFSKESAAVLPGLMLLYDLTWRERATWRRRAPAYAVVALPFAAFFRLAQRFADAHAWSNSPRIPW